MVFCKGKNSSLIAFKELFTKYAACSGQIININKSFIYVGGISDSRLDSIVNMLGFYTGAVPFNYLGAPIFKGKPKVIHFQLVVDKIKTKLDSWKASLLYMAGRVQMVKSVINNMLLHTMAVYSWPISLLREIERWIKNFIWSGDKDKRKLVIVSWKKVCSDLFEGGLGIKSLICLNEATKLKLCWDMLHSNEQWASLIRSRAIRGKSCISHHIYSSIWSGIKGEYQVIMNNSNWLLGDGQKINFWSDNWCGVHIADHFQIPISLSSTFPQHVNAFMVNKQWSIPIEIQNHVPLLKNLVTQVTIPTADQSDQLVWNHNASGNLPLKDAFHFKKHHHMLIPWTKCIWNKDIPPSKAMLVWRMMMGKLPTDDLLAQRGCHLP